MSQSLATASPECTSSDVFYTQITRAWCQPQVQRTLNHILGSQLRLGLPGLVPLKENKAWATMTIHIISFGCDCVQLYSTNVWVHLWGVFIEQKTLRKGFLRNPAVLLTRSLTGWAWMSISIVQLIQETENKWKVFLFRCFLTGAFFLKLTERNTFLSDYCK